MFCNLVCCVFGCVHGTHTTNIYIIIHHMTHCYQTVHQIASQETFVEGQQVRSDGA